MRTLSRAWAAGTRGRSGPEPVAWAPATAFPSALISAKGINTFRHRQGSSVKEGSVIELT